MARLDPNDNALVFAGKSLQKHKQYTAMCSCCFFAVLFSVDMSTCVPFHFICLNWIEVKFKIKGLEGTEIILCGLYSELD